MEDDDEFGDLYTDVLHPFTSSSSLSSAPPPQVLSSAPPPLHRPIHLNLNKNDDEDDDDIFYGATRRNISSNQTLADSAHNSIPSAVNVSAGGARVLGLSDAEFSSKGLDAAESVGFQSDIQEKEVKFDIEDDGNDSGQMMIPGLAVSMEDSRREAADVGSGGRGGGEQGDEDWDEDSDSEDDLQIVLNDSNHGPMGMERGMMGDDDDDDDGEPLVIVGDGDQNHTMEEQDWGVGEDGAAAAVPGTEGERKDGSETASKGNVAVAIPKIGYSNHGYHHPFHSQFKYVRPGAAPMPGTTTIAPGGAPGQVRPPVNMGLMASRGRGDWRPAGIKNGPQVQKSFHPGFGMPVWGNNMAGRGFGGGLDFTLPSHKTIFDVDIDSFEEKPWKYPGVDISDFFNFGLNEESWKDYCKQLEQHRLETTMQSKIRVYESGRAEQDYDPDLPPELAAATGIHDAAADTSNVGKSDAGQSDMSKGLTRVRPPIPIGRPIQVETSYGERLPSIDTRLPRIRDSDAIIEIVLQDSVDDDSSTGNFTAEGANSVLPKDDNKGNHVAEDDVTPTEAEYFDDFPEPYDSRKSGRRAQYMGSDHNNMPDEDGNLTFHPGGPTEHRPAARRQPGGDNLDTPQVERRTQRKADEESPQSTPERSTQEKRFLDNAEEESIESMDGKHSLSSSPGTVRDARELSVEDKEYNVRGDIVLTEGSSGMEKDDVTENDVITKDKNKDRNMHHFAKKQKMSSHIGQLALQAPDDGEDSKAARSSENSKARSGSSRDYQKWQDGVEEEVVQDGHSARSGSLRRQLNEHEENFRRKDRDARQEMGRNRMVRGREGSYPHRGLDPGLSHHLHLKNETYDRRKEREHLDGTWERRDEDLHGRKSRTEDTRKRERGDELGSRHRSKIRESEGPDKDEHLHWRKQLDSGSYRAHYDKDGSSRHKEREDSLKPRYEVLDDYHGKRRKEEEYSRRDHADKEEVSHAHRETGQRRRERDDALDPRKRDNQQRIRESLDDYHSVRQKDEAWLQRERGERQREREELYRLKPSYEENISKREREEGRVSMKSGRGADDKSWTAHVRVDEYKGSDKEYQYKDAVRNTEQQKRRDRVEDASFSHHRVRDDVNARGNQSSNEERRSGHDKSITRTDRAVDTNDNQRLHEKKHKEITRKSKESEGRDHRTSGPSKRNKEDQSARADKMGSKGTGEQGNGENVNPVQRNSSKRHKEDMSSDEEQQSSKRGRSKLERWTSHKERDFSIGGKSSAPMKFKDTDKNNNVGSSDAHILPNELPKRVEAVEKLTLGEEKDAIDGESKNTNPKPLEDRHLDTVEKLKKRSERFKLPMPSEKEALAIKKIENEALPSLKTETNADSGIKQERPARKRRWISN